MIGPRSDCFEKCVRAVLVCALALVSACASGSSGSGANASSGSGKCGVPSAVCNKLSAGLTEANAVVSKRCVKCHSPGGVAGRERDFTADGVVLDSKQDILSEVSECSMPPPGSARLTDEERAAIECWASAAAAPATAAPAAR